ncbi:MAG: Metallophosphoesterase [Gemmatimonadetes bacterium]|nr:Metallophosphoesterase [Gemmatimonadota bacterium]
MRSLLRSTAVPFLAVLLAPLAAACRGDAAKAAAHEERLAASDSVVTDSLYGARGADNVRVVPVEIEVRDLPAGWDGIRIAALSDFQLGLWPDNENVAAAAVRKALDAKPDLVVLLGDYVARGGDYGALDRILAPLRGHTVMAVLGHTDESDDPQASTDTLRDRTMQALTRNGVQVLRNARAPFFRNGDTAYVAGLAPFVARKGEDVQAAIFAGIPGGPRTPVVLSHMAAVAARIPDGKWPAILAGHAFCGRVEVPGTPRLAWINTEVLPIANGSPTQRTYRIHDNALFITCGVGYSFLPARFATPPEVALVTLRRVGSVAKPDSAHAAQAANLDSLADAVQRRTAARNDSAARGDSARKDTTKGPPIE